MPSEGSALSGTQCGRWGMKGKEPSLNQEVGITWELVGQAEDFGFYSELCEKLLSCKN